MSDRRIQELLRRFRQGDPATGPALILALGRADQLGGSVLSWKSQDSFGRHRHYEEEIFEWDSCDGFRCPECDVFAKLGPIQISKYERGDRYVFNCCPEVSFPLYQDLRGSFTLGENRGALTVSQIADLVGDYLIEIKTEAEIQEEQQENALENQADNQHARKLSEKALAERKLKNAKQRAKRWTKKLEAFDKEHGDQIATMRTGTSWRLRLKRQAIQEKIEEIETHIADLSPTEPEAPPSMSVFRSALIDKHHLDSLWLAKCAGGLNGVAVDLIMVEPEHRGEGHGQRAMEELCEYADRVGLYLALTPSNVHGSSVKRLKKWYRSLGFKNNKGRGADYRFSETMLRTPRGEENG